MIHISRESFMFMLSASFLSLTKHAIPETPIQNLIGSISVAAIEETHLGWSLSCLEMCWAKSARGKENQKLQDASLLGTSLHFTNTLHCRSDSKRLPHTGTSSPMQARRQMLKLPAKLEPEDRPFKPYLILLNNPCHCHANEYPRNVRQNIVGDFGAG